MGLVINSSDTADKMAQSIKGQKLNKNIVEYIMSPKFETGSFLRNEMASNSNSGLRNMFANAERSSSIFEQLSSSIDSNVSDRGFFKKIGDFITGNTDNMLNSQYRSLIKRNVLSGKSIDESVTLAQQSIKDGKIGIAAKLRGASGKTTDLIDGSSKDLAKKIADGTSDNLGKTLLAASDGAKKTGVFSKLKKYGGTLFMLAGDIINEGPKVVKAFKEGGIGNGLKQIVKSTVQVGLTNALTAVATGLIGMIPVIGPAIAASGVVSNLLNMFIYSPCQKIAEAVTSLPIFEVEGVQSETEAMQDLKELGYTEDQIDAACMQYGVSSAAELNELIQAQAEAGQASTTAATITSNGGFSQWLNNQTMAMNPSTGVYA